ncbi:heat shock 70 kDa protein 12A-like [Argopecten irradians]|uniref:heat shock 70 kDa protein 12A-like n=1 Tax=Argopecten irradians TaxID=31199 RepID=UPI00371FC5E7
MASSKNHLIVAAIDFGTTYSGYAFSTRDDHNRDPLNVSANNWNSGSGGLISQKTSTCVLFKPNREFDSFGYEAENKYADLALDKKHSGWRYFRRFKMKLYENKLLNRAFELEDDQGSKMPAMKVFSSSIWYMRTQLMKTCRNRYSDIEDSDILWVLTVPAIWSDASKQFMREAAVEAGIKDCNLKLALEPEAASLYCKYIPNEKGDEGMSSFSCGSKYLVLDAGGGTIDITVHQVQEDGSLKEIHKANGGDWGGTKVDNAYQALLTGIIGDKGFAKFCKENKGDMIDLFRDFEIKKRTIKSFPDDDDAKVNFKIPASMNKRRDIQKTVKSKFKKDFSVTSDKLRVAGHIARNLFNDPVMHIIDHLKTIMSEDQAVGIKAIMLVGGFSESPVLQSKVREAFPDIRMVVPPEAGLAVLKGAVIFGHEPETITTRISKYTYGIDTSVKFEEGVHDPAKLFTTSYGEDRCECIFAIHVCIGDSIDIDKPQARERYKVNEPDQKVATLKVYVSTQKDPMYTTDPGCLKIGELRIDMADTSRGLERGVDVRMIFGNTELEVQATDIFTGESVTAAFDFLK